MKTCLSPAVYLGVLGYGALTAADRDCFLHRFFTDGREVCFPVSTAGNYTIQNTLQEGRAYRLHLENGTVITASPVDSLCAGGDAPVHGTPGLKTLRNLLTTAMEPVGTTLYIYGGGWDWQDAHAAPQAMTIGLPPSWPMFFRSQTAAYRYRDDSDPAHSFYPYGGWNQYYYAGADCSGYLGWVIYNLLQTRSASPAGCAGYVTAAADMAGRLAGAGLGTLMRCDRGDGLFPAAAFRPGDLFSLRGHVWLCAGICGDGSILILHSTPSPARDGTGQGGGVQLSALNPDAPASTDCAAFALAEHTMKTCYPAWSARYAVQLKDYRVYAALAENPCAGCLRWALPDPDGFAACSAGEILSVLTGRKLYAPADAASVQGTRRPGGA